MKKIALALITILLFGVKTIRAQEQELSASEPISSGCLSQSRGTEAPTLPTIKLTKEGDILSVDLFNFISNCGTTDFEMETRMFGGNNNTPSVVISVIPVVPSEMDCVCPFNISYTVYGLEENNFFLKCWWYEGQVELTEGEPLVLEYKTEDVVIDGLKYQLLKSAHQAKLLQCVDEVEILQIPSEVEYKGEKYTVTSINFGPNNTIKKIIIPKTIKNTEFGSLEGINSHLFSSCLSIETIEVEEGNPVICSLDGVLFNKDRTTLIGYPAASSRELYTVPDGVKTMVSGAIINSQHLKKIVLPNTMKKLGYTAFGHSKSLEEVILSSNIKELPGYLFIDCIKLKSVVIPEGITTIGFSAFEGCSSLGAISMPKSVTTVGMSAFTGCTSLKSATLSPNLKVIPLAMFSGCSKLTEVIIPFGITTIGNGAFRGCEAMQSFDLPESINYIDGFAFGYLSNLKDIYCHAKIVPNTDNNAFRDIDLSQVNLHVPATSIDNYQSSSPWNQFGAIVPLETEVEYRPFVEEGKVWKVGTISGNPVKVVDYYYFDGDTIVGGKTCKQMMCQRFVGSDFTDDSWTPTPSLSKVGAWYEEDKKVYFYDESKQSMVLKYDFSLGDNESLQLIDDYPPFTIGRKQTGGIEGFKGVYRDVMISQNVRSTTWLEGVGGVDGPTRNVYPENADPMPEFLMSCTVGDEVIYLNDEYEDGATPHVLLARKNRFDFTHTIKTRPRLPRNNGSGDAETSEMDDAEESEELSIYGEYSTLQLDINLDPLDDAYQVRITNASGQVVYEKTINAGSIVALSIDISAYADGCYTVTVENSDESFTGEFNKQTTGIDAIRNNKEVKSTEIFNLHGQRLRSLQKGLNIVNGKKYVMKE